MIDETKLEEIAEKHYNYQTENPPYTIITPKDKIRGFIDGYKLAQEKLYSEEEVLDILLLSYSSISDRSLAGADLRK